MLGVSVPGVGTGGTLVAGGTYPPDNVLVSSYTLGGAKDRSPVFLFLSPVPNQSGLFPISQLHSRLVIEEIFFSLGGNPCRSFLLACSYVICMVFL